MLIKTEFQKSFEVLLQQNKQLFEDVEPETKSAEEAAIASGAMFSKFINSMRYPAEAKLNIISGNTNENTQNLS